MNPAENSGLKKVLGPWSVVAFGVTNEIAGGLFFLSTQIQGNVPGAGDWVPWLMVIGGALTFLTVVAYRYFFASGLVGAGGEYVIVSRALNPAAAFLATFLAWFGVTAGMGALAYSATKFLSNACSSVGWLALAEYLKTDAGILITGLVLIWGIYLIHVRGVKLAGVLTVAAMCFVIFVAAIIVIAGVVTTPGAFEAALAAKLHMSASAVVAHANVQTTDTGAAFWKALPLLFFGYLGLSTATQTGGEAKDAQRSLSRGVVIAVSIVTAIYTIFAFAVYHAVPWRIMQGLTALKMTTYTTSTGLLGLVMPGWLSSLLNVFVAIIVVKTFLPYFLAQSRWLYAWGADGVIHGAFSRTHSKYETPVLALTISAVLGSLALFECVLLHGYVFGVSVRVFSVMLVFFLMGLAMIAFPKTAPALYAANESTMARARVTQIAVGIAIMLFSTWFGASVLLGSLDQPWYLQPGLQVVAVGIAGALVYYFGKVRSRDVSAIQA